MTRAQQQQITIALFDKGGSSHGERGIYRRKKNRPFPFFFKGGNKSAAGFTLLEVLLAMVITALVAVMAYAGLSAAINAASRHGEVVQRLGDVQTAISWIVRDLRECVNRSIVDAHDQKRPALIGGTDNEELLELTRSGWDNPRGQRRSTLQRVHYRLDADHNLWRDNWVVLDRVNDEDHLQQVKLLSGVLSFKAQFLNPQTQNTTDNPLGGEWVEQWPVLQNDTEHVPLAVQFDIEIEGIGVIHRVVGLANESKNP